MIDFKNNLIKQRKISGLTQACFAGILNISQQTYASYESGKARPKITRLCQIASILKIKIDVLLE